MMLLLRDDRVLETFASAAAPPDGLEGIDVLAGEYEFCDEYGQRYRGAVKSHAWRGTSGWGLVPDGPPM